MIMIEQSCKLAAQAYVFQPNDQNTWSAVTSMISSFLTSVWKEGGLQGATATQAFSVNCGLGTTMTSGDILNGMMNVTVQVAVVHPAEFIVITFQQQMAGS
jgi:phage tail sheath protein FI